MDSHLKQKRTLLALFHISPLLNFAVPFLGLIIPIVIWLSKKDIDPDYNRHGIHILNFMATMFLITLGLALVFGSGLAIGTYFQIPGPAIFSGGALAFFSFAIGVFSLYMHIVNARRAYADEPIEYKFSFKLIS